MIDLCRNICELGLLKTVQVLQEVGNDAIPEHLLTELPLLPQNTFISERVAEIHDAIIASGKREILLLSPEIALLEFLSDEPHIHFQIIIPHDMDKDMVKRIQNNIPTGVDVTFLNEPFFPRDFFPSNGLLMAFGFQNDNRCLLLRDTLRLMEHYKGFMGKKVFVPINRDGKKCSRPPSWIECYKGAYFNEQYE